MAVQFLSEEFMTQASERLNASSDFLESIGGISLDVQFVVTDAPEDATINYILAIADAKASLSRGNTEDFDASITSSYETASEISRDKLDTQMAFMTGKIKIGGNPAKLIMHQNVFREFGNALKSMEISY